MIPKSISHVILREMVAVDDVIRTSLRSNIDLIEKVATHIVGGGGKRLRPALVVLSSLASGLNEAGSNHYKLAAVVEFIHTATLLHDDVVDESELRRGKASANSVFGNEAAVLVGDFLYSRAFQLVAEVENLDVTAELANATNTIAEGEVKQLIDLGDPNITENRYFEILISKTAQLFKTSCRLGAILGNLDDEQSGSLESYGLNLGIAFQLIDDALDYRGDESKFGKKIGDDFSQGKVTLPLIHAMKKGSMSETAFIKDAIKLRSISRLDKLLDILVSTKSIEYVDERARQQINIAIESLRPLSDSKYKKCLVDLATFALIRDS